MNFELFFPRIGPRVMATTAPGRPMPLSGADPEGFASSLWSWGYSEDELDARPGELAYMLPFLLFGDTYLGDTRRTVQRISRTVKHISNVHVNLTQATPPGAPPAGSLGQRMWKSRKERFFFNLRSPGGFAKAGAVLSKQAVPARPSERVLRRAAPPLASGWVRRREREKELKEGLRSLREELRREKRRLRERERSSAEKRRQERRSSEKRRTVERAVIEKRLRELESRRNRLQASLESLRETRERLSQGRLGRLARISGEVAKGDAVRGSSLRPREGKAATRSAPRAPQGVSLPRQYLQGLSPATQERPHPADATPGARSLPLRPEALRPRSPGRRSIFKLTIPLEDGLHGPQGLDLGVRPSMFAFHSMSAVQRSNFADLITPEERIFPLALLAAFSAVLRDRVQSSRFKVQSLEAASEGGRPGWNAMFGAARPWDPLPLSWGVQGSSTIVQRPARGSGVGSWESIPGLPSLPDYLVRRSAPFRQLRTSNFELRTLGGPSPGSAEEPWLLRPRRHATERLHSEYAHSFPRPLRLGVGPPFTLRGAPFIPAGDAQSSRSDDHASRRGVDRGGDASFNWFPLNDSPASEGRSSTLNVRDSTFRDLLYRSDRRRFLFPLAPSLSSLASGFSGRAPGDDGAALPAGPIPLLRRGALGLDGLNGRDGQAGPTGPALIPGSRFEVQNSRDSQVSRVLPLGTLPLPTFPPAAPREDMRVARLDSDDPAFSLESYSGGWNLKAVEHRRLFPGHSMVVAAYGPRTLKAESRAPAERRKEVVELVREQVEVQMNGTQVVKRLARGDYLKIAEHVYSALARRLAAERERLGLP